MTEREKVIKEFEADIQDFSPADTSDERFKEVCNAVLALLKAQEPRLMTLEEVKEIGRFEFDNTDRSKETVVWFEKRNGNAFNGWLAPSRIEYCYHPEYGDDEYCDSVIQYVSGSEVTSRLHCGVYGKYWRCWTQRPTYKQREAVKWNGTI